MISIRQNGGVRYRFYANPEGMRQLCYTEKGTVNSYRAEELVKEFYDPEGVKGVLAKY